MGNRRKEITLGDIGPPVDPNWDEGAFYVRYFRDKAANGDRLKPLGKPCHDCAIVCNFYTAYSDELAKQPADIQIEASLRWFCHNHPDRACRGNIDRLGIATETAPPLAQRGAG